MPVNPNIESPTFLDWPTADGSSNYTFGSGGGGATCRAVDVWAAGTLHIADVKGIEKTRTFAGPFPVRWVIQIRKIFGDSGITIGSSGDIDPLQ